MTSVRNLLRTAGLAAAAFVSLRAQTPPSAAEIVRSVRETYANVTQVRFSMLLTRRSIVESRIVKETTMGIRVAAKFPKKLRWEMDDDFVKLSGSNLGPLLMVMDGKSTWIYASRLNEYTVEIGSDPDLLKTVDEFLPGYGLKLKDEAKLLREETIEADGKRVNCYVVEIPEEVEEGLYPQWWTWWVDESRHVVLRADRKRVGPKGSDEASMLYRNIAINEPIPEDVFVLAPPPGAKKVDDFSQQR